MAFQNFLPILAYSRITRALLESPQKQKQAVGVRARRQAQLQDGEEVVKQEDADKIVKEEEDDRR